MRWTLLGIGFGAGLMSLVAGATSALAAYFARQIVTPARAREENLEVLAVVRTAAGEEIILPATEDTVVHGTYGLFFDGGRGHARIGAITSYVPREGTVQRTVERVYSGDLTAATRGWWSGSLYPSPSAFGLAEEQVDIPVQGGTAPAWLIRGDTADHTWAIMVHGRGATRLEGLRAARSAFDAGMTSLLISYRNDGEAPAAADGRYTLGMTEWHDVEAAIEYALSAGARKIVLFGWSMGGAICLRTAERSAHADKILALVLDGPVINWVDVLAHHARLNRIPPAVGRFSLWLLSNAAGRALTGLAAPLDLRSMDWVARADELRHPVLIIHSVDDEFVPFGPSAELAQRNPVMVTYEEFHDARHTKEWNVDPERWDRVVGSWLARVSRRTRPRFSV